MTIAYRRRQLKHVTEKLELKHKYQQEVLQTQLEVQEQSFRYVSEEIHDNIAQTLSLVKLKLYRTAGKTTDEVAKAGLDTSTELLGNALNDLRNLSHVLNGGLVSKWTLLESLEKELAYVRDANGLDAKLETTGEIYELTAEQKLMTFRTIQEAINNAVKHGRATEVCLLLLYNRDLLTVKISDNGSGFDTATIAESKGMGLHNMHVRAQMLGGIHIDSSPGAGTTISLNIQRT